LTFTFAFSHYTSSKSKSESEEYPAQKENLSQSVIDPTPTPHTLVGSYYLVDENIEAKLLLNNKGNAPLEVQPTLYNKQGQELQLPSVTVDTQNFRFINLSDWAAIGGESFKSGNIKLFHYGKDLVLGAQIYLTDEARSLSYEEKLTEKGKFDSRRQEAVWWMPSSEAKVKIVLTNTTDTPLDVTGKLAKKPNTVSNPQTIQLAAHQTRVFDLRDDFPNSSQFLSAEILALSLEHTGANDALLARVLVAEPQRGYSNVVQFSNPNGGKSSEYQGVGFQIEDIDGIRFAPVVVARNVGTTSATVTARVPYTRSDGTRGTINLPQKQLSAGEIGFINTLGIITRVQQEQIKVASLEVEYNTAPGSVVVAAHSVSEDHNQVFRVPMWDPFGQRSPTGGYPWRIEGTSVTQTYIKNITDLEEDYVAFLVWENGGMYMLGSKPVAARETVHIDVKKLRDEQIPDEQGRTIPLAVSSGQLQWTLRRKDNLADDDVRANLSLIGRSEQVDVDKGVTNNYSCQNCCAGTHISGFIFPSSIEIEYGETAHFGSVEVEETCYGFPYQFNIGAGWSSSNSGMGTISGGSITPQSVGQSTIGASWWAQRSRTEPCADPPPLFGFPDETAENCNDRKLKRGGPSVFESENIPINSSLLSPPCGSCIYSSFIYIPPSASLVVKPIVGSLKAEISQSNSSQTSSFTTYNESLQFAQNSSDLFVGFKGGYKIEVTAENVEPSTVAGSLKWFIDRDPADPSTSDMDTGEPSFYPSQPIGQYATINPNQNGNFILINYYDADQDNTFDSGEELRVLKFALVKAEIPNGGCTINTSGDFDVVFSGLSGLQSVNTHDIIGDCTVILKSGGADKSVGLDQVQVGPVSNMISFYELSNSLGRNREIFYGDRSDVKGTDVPRNPNLEYPTLAFKPLNGVDGDQIFRDGYSHIINPNSSGGKQFRVGFRKPALAIDFQLFHPAENLPWSSLTGDQQFGELIVGFVTGRNKSYVVFAKSIWQVNFSGEPDKDGKWRRTNALISLQGDPAPIGDTLTKPYTSTLDPGGSGSVSVVEDPSALFGGVYRPWLNPSANPNKAYFDDTSIETKYVPEIFKIVDAEDGVVLDDARVGTFYTVSNKICGSQGITPYIKWEMPGNSIPGLTLTPGSPCATLSGTPTQAGIYSFDVTAKDYFGIPDTGTYYLTVNP